MKSTNKADSAVNLIHVAYGAATWKLDDKGYHQSHTTHQELDFRWKSQHQLLCSDPHQSQKLEEKFDKEFLSIEKFELTYNIDEVALYDDIWTTLSASYRDGLIVVYNGEEKYLGDDIVYVKIFEFKANTDFRIADSIKAQAINEPRFYIADKMVKIESTVF
ncbi:hypothetical protein EB796_011525 [Bugula neritina]|uniref:Uncharacterized protein n=1 Tax=Bugula neritina TaxID=10212 RepID=A0A7J7JUX6_BUGNE|nr:hypothetical protein EB796_011525 [Bugula neritina]